MTPDSPSGAGSQPGTDPDTDPRPRDPRPRDPRPRYGAIAVAVALGLVAVLVCGGLGWWQWSRAETTGRTVEPAPAVDVAQVIAPAQSPGTALGRQVTVTGTWSEATPAVVAGREVDGVAATMLVRALEVPAESTGTGASATLAVVVGWAPGTPPDVAARAGERVTIEGYLRAPESSAGLAIPDGAAPDGAFWAAALATSELAQTWPAPLYGALLVAYEAEPGWTALEPPPPTREINFRSAAYAIEWWIFGAFAAFLAVRWIRDNGRVSPTREDDA